MKTLNDLEKEYREFSSREPSETIYAAHAVLGDERGERDFPEDSKFENGNYTCICSNCGKQFIGYKRRTFCKVCEKKGAK